jgi:N-acetylmuramoyl-L-alanine amidase
MQDSFDFLRRRWVEAGQSTARFVILTCSIGLAAMFGAAQMGYGRAAPPPANPPPTAQTRQITPPDDSSPTPAPSPPAEPTRVNLEPSGSAQAQNQPTPTLAPSPTPTPAIPRIGIVAGHWWLGEGGQQSLDVGAVCDEGTPSQLTEVEINKDVAERVVTELRRAGYQVDFLQEWDDRLPGYGADVLVSIHADACTYPEATGFKVARVVDSHVPEIEDRLVACLVEHYGRRTGLPFHEGSITHDMTQYHTFYEIDPNTPGAIIETGFMAADRWLLTQRADLVAQGIIDGILCFLEGEGRISR